MRLWLDRGSNAGQPDRLLQLKRRVILCMNGDNAAAKQQRGDRVKDYSQNDFNFVTAN
jgi:hypothetical protein